MKKTVIFIAFLSLVLRGVSFGQNPYQSIGKEMPKGKMLTLSNGKFQEFFPNDTLVPIGSVMYNTVTGEVVAFLTRDTMYAEYNLEPELVSRWLSPDPLAEKYVYQTPYNYVSNNPIKMIDPDGRDNIVYVLALPGSDKKAMSGVEASLNKMFKDAGINAKVHMVTDAKKFDINKIDKTDAVAVVGGTKQEASDYISKNFKGWTNDKFVNGESGDGKSLTSWLGTKLNPEITDGYGEGDWSYVTAISTQQYDNMSVSQYEKPDLVDIGKTLGITNRSSFVAFNILHGVGHLSGIKHIDSPASFMAEGNSIKSFLTEQGAYAPGKVNEMIKQNAANYPDLIQQYNNRFQQTRNGQPVIPTLNYAPK